MCRWVLSGSATHVGRDRRLGPSGERVPLLRRVSLWMRSTAAGRDRSAWAAGRSVVIRAAVAALRIALVLALLAAATTHPVAAGTPGAASLVGNPSVLRVDGFYHADGLGSARAVTDAAGAVVRLEQTDEFGAPTATAGTRTQPFGYTGAPVDPSSGLVDLRARLYDPPSGRFLTRDGFPGYADLPLSLNRYSYVLNDPATLTDPSGEFPILPAVVCGAGAVAGIALGGQGSGEKLTGRRVLRDAGAGCLTGLSILTGGALALGLRGGSQAVFLTGAALARAGIRAEERVARNIGVRRNVGPGQVRIPGTGKGGYRVPDFDPAATIAKRGTIVEVKDVRHLRPSRQLRDLVAEAQARGRQLEIRTNARRVAPSIELIPTS